MTGCDCSVRPLSCLRIHLFKADVGRKREGLGLSQSQVLVLKAVVWCWQSFMRALAGSENRWTVDTHNVWPPYDERQLPSCAPKSPWRQRVFIALVRLIRILYRKRNNIGNFADQIPKSRENTEVECQRFLFFNRKPKARKGLELGIGLQRGGRLLIHFKKLSRNCQSKFKLGNST